VVEHDLKVARVFGDTEAHLQTARQGVLVTAHDAAECVWERGDLPCPKLAAERVSDLRTDRDSRRHDYLCLRAGL
jgi:hypothetical protein